MLTNDTTPKGTTPLEWQSVPGTQAMICKKPYLIYDLPTDSKLTYFAKTSGGTDDPTLQVINNIKSDVMSGTTAVTAPLFTPYTDVSLQQESTEAYSEKVKLTYDTPSTTSAEKQFQKGAYIKYKESDGTCVLTTTFDVLSGTPVTLTIDGTYTPGSKTNQNTSSIKFDGLALNRTDTYNKTIGKNKVMIDGIVYYVGVTTDKQKHIPTVVFSHVEDDTLEAVDGWTEKYKITSNVFGEKLANNKVENYDKVNTGFGDCAYGPLRIVSGQRADPIKYSKDINLGQVKGEDKRILVQ